MSVLSFNKLVNVDEVPVVIGGFSSSSALAIAPRAEESNVVLFSPAASSPSLTNAGDFIFRNELSDEYGGKKQAELCWQELGLRKIDILYINNDYGVGIKKSFEDTFTILGGIINTESFNANETNFKSQLIKIKNRRQDAIFIIAYNEISNIIKQTKELGISSQLLSTPIFEDKEIINKCGDAANNVIYAYYGTFNTTTSNKVKEVFKKSFKEEYNLDPSYYAALAYDALFIIANAIKTNGYSSIDIKEGLYKISNFEVVTGITTIDKYGDVQKPVILKTVINGKFVEYNQRKK